jgi:hypothetical protein
MYKSVVLASLVTLSTGEVIRLIPYPLLVSDSLEVGSVGLK